MSAYRIHFQTDRLSVHGQPFFACGRHQQIFKLRTSTDWNKVTCLACLKTKHSKLVVIVARRNGKALLDDYNQAILTLWHIQNRADLLALCLESL